MNYRKQNYYSQKQIAIGILQLDSDSPSSFSLPTFPVPFASSRDFSCCVRLGDRLQAKFNKENTHSSRSSFVIPVPTYSSSSHLLWGKNEELSTFDSTQIEITLSLHFSAIILPITEFLAKFLAASPLIELILGTALTAARASPQQFCSKAAKQLFHSKV